MQKLVNQSPEEKQKGIQNLYEAVQLFQLSDFREVNDNQYVWYEDLKWEFHKPGYYSVLSNEGCCASDTSWLLYILEGKYEEIGVFSILREFGSGHSLNYILSDGWYYFVDLLAHIDPYRQKVSPETGKLSDFAKSSYNTGICLKAKTIDDFAKYYDRFMITSSVENMYYYYPEKIACVPIATKESTVLECFLPICETISFTNNKNKKIHIKRSETLPDATLIWET